MSDLTVAMIIFNRPRHTAQSFECVRAQQPTKLFIIADGPRLDQPGDQQKCEDARAIVEQIDWPCEVHRNYAEQNMGLKQRVSSGLDWVFDQVESAIILEDDCVPHPDFFGYCQDLLDRYKHDNRIWVVTGNNFQQGKRRGDASYYFSKFGHCWGWASWRRAWQQFDGDIAFWPTWKSSPDWEKKMPDPLERQYWIEILDRAYAGKIDSWGYPWLATLWFHGALTAIPQVNLVTNIGVGPDGTHTFALEDEPGIPVKPLGILTHPLEIKQNTVADQYFFDHELGGLDQKFPRKYLAFPRRVKNKLLRILKGQA
jgi:hypothetical protein